MSENGDVFERPRRDSEYNTFNKSHTDDIHNEKDGEKLFTVQEAIDSLGFGRYQIKISLLTGLCYMADAVEMMLLSILGPVLKCEFYLSGTQEALFTSATFLGMFVTASLWGRWCDQYGRRHILSFAATMCGYFGMLTALSPGYFWVLFCRLLVGIYLGASQQSMTYYAEFLPTKLRGVCVMAIVVTWAGGSTLEVLLALFVIPAFGWRWLLVLSSLPLCIFAACFKILPESPYYFAAQGQLDKAMEVLREMAKANRQQMPPGSLQLPDDKPADSGKLKDLFIPQYRKTTILLLIIWFAGNGSYYGTALLNTALFANKDGCHGYGSDNSVTVRENCKSMCQTMTSSDYVDLMITSVGDSPGLLLCLLLMMKMGRKKMLATLTFMYAVVMGVCNICTPRFVLIILLFIARALVLSVSQASVIYTAEVYPAHMRALAVGFCSSLMRTSVIVIPFVSQVLINITAYLPITIYTCLGLVASVCSLLLPIETANRGMQVTSFDAI